MLLDVNAILVQLLHFSDLYNKEDEEKERQESKKERIDAFSSMKENFFH